MTTESERQNAILGREGAYSARNSTRCIAYSLGSGCFEAVRKRRPIRDQQICLRNMGAGLDVQVSLPTFSVGPEFPGP